MEPQKSHTGNTFKPATLPSKEESLKIIESLKSWGLVVVDEKYLQELHIKANKVNRVDARVSWLTQKQVMEKYNVTEYWLKEARKDPNTRLVIKTGKAKNAKVKILESSVIAEQKRNAS